MREIGMFFFIHSIRCTVRLWTTHSIKNEWIVLASSRVSWHGYHEQTQYISCISIATQKSWIWNARCLCHGPLCRSISRLRSPVPRTANRAKPCLLLWHTIIRHKLSSCKIILIYLVRAPGAINSTYIKADVNRLSKAQCNSTNNCCFCFEIWQQSYT